MVSLVGSVNFKTSGGMKLNTSLFFLPVKQYYVCYMSLHFDKQDNCVPTDAKDESEITQPVKCYITMRLFMYLIS